MTYGEIEALDPELAADPRAFELALTARQEAIKAAVVSHQWANTVQDLTNPAARLQALADKLNAEAETLENASDEKARAALQKQFSELDARVRLSLVKDAAWCDGLLCAVQRSTNERPQCHDTGPAGA